MSTIIESLKDVVLAKLSSQPQSIYEAATSLTKFKLKKILIDKMEKTVSLKRDRKDKDKDEDPPAGSDQGMKRRKTSKDVESSKEEPIHTVDDTEVQQNQGQDMGNTDDQPNVEAAPKHDCIKKPERPPTLDLDWNVGKSVDFRPPQTSISKIAQAEKPPLSFDELMSTPIDFSAYVMNHLKIDNLTQDHLNKPEGKEYPFDLSKPLPLIMDRGRPVVPVDYFINNNLEYLRGGSSSMKYTTSTTKTKAAKYDIQGIEDMVPSLWSPVKWYDYGYMEEIKVRREDQQLYKFKEGDFPRLHLHDIKDMLLLLVQKKLSNLERDVIFDVGCGIMDVYRRIVILKRVEDLQLGVESYQKKLNITKPETFRSDISNRIPYTAYNNPQGIIYEDKYKINRLMRTDELYKFSDGTLTSDRGGSVEMAATTATILEAVQDSSNIAKTQSMATPTEPISQETGSDGGNTPRSDEDSMTLQELTALCTRLSDRVLALETDLRQTKKVYGTAYTKLIMKVKKLEKTVKTSQARRRAKIVVSDDDMASEDSSKQGRMIEEIDQDVGVTLVTPTKVSSQEDQPEDQLGVLSAAKVLADAARVHTYSRRRRAVSTGSGGVSTASRIVSTAGMIQQVNIIIPSSSATKDKGKAIMTESEPEQTTTKLKQRQERAGYEAAIRLQEQLDEEESQRIARDAEILE
ncbi:hypothetical protein Tco_0797871 [Tanacetum coccineum]